MDGVLAVPGVRVAASTAAIKHTGRDDIALLVLAEGSTVAGVFTRSSFRAAPVQVAETRISSGGIRALIINSGNANAATGAPGVRDALAVCAQVEQLLEVAHESVIPFSTGVIGERLPVERMIGALSVARDQLADDNWPAVARAIMTTDTAPKALSRVILVAGQSITVTGMAKGAGMIKPDMATMLAFICCDASIEASCLDTLTREVAEKSFNRITVDGDTSTNDSFVVCATAMADQSRISNSSDAAYCELRDGILGVALELAQRLVRDAEGATKFVTVRVSGGAEPWECLAVANTIAESPLVKTAMFAGDANWGRFCMAIGRAGIPDLDTGGVALFLDDVCVARNGLMATDYEDADGARVMARDEYVVSVELGRGDFEEVVWTSDLSHEYIRINSEYRT
ncbi:MAG: bifunctional glutamate N-acetyltransferase/amino-acid acetyltransferase ArgJ [Gammaproteobacteria bacterium]|nr:bifunctional glutamate N-acetyltransferase/amino-acid acetyltransferase ArgJ [Gammaproteobacteria bacterium]